MTDTTATRDGPPEAPRQEDDALRLRPIAIATLVVLAFIGAALGLSRLGVRTPVPRGVGEPAAEAVVRLSMIGADPSAELARAAKRRRLERWGWVDAERGILHMPIERAMALRLAREAAAAEDDP